MQQEQIVFSDNFIRLYKLRTRKDRAPYEMAYKQALYDFAKELYARIPAGVFNNVEIILERDERNQGRNLLPNEEFVDDIMRSFILGLHQALPNDRYFAYSKGYIPMRRVWKLFGPFTTAELVETWYAVSVIKRRFIDLFSFLGPEVGMVVDFERGYKNQSGFKFYLSLKYKKSKNLEIVKSLEAEKQTET